MKYSIGILSSLSLVSSLLGAGRIGRRSRISSITEDKCLKIPFLGQPFPLFVNFHKISLLAVLNIVVVL